MIALMGIILFVVFLSMSVWVFGTWVAGHTVQGWTSVMLHFLLIASFQTFAIAVIGEYVGKIYFETKSRPRYIVEAALYRQCLRPKSRVVAQRRRELAKWLFARDSVIGYYAGDRPWKARPNKLR
jgi:hypothetical protein